MTALISEQKISPTSMGDISANSSDIHALQTRFKNFTKASNLPTESNKNLLDRTAEFAGYSYMGQKIQNQLKEVEKCRQEILKLFKTNGSINTKELQKRTECYIGSLGVTLCKKDFKAASQKLAGGFPPEAKKQITAMRNLLASFNEAGHEMETTQIGGFLAPLVRAISFTSGNARAPLIELYQYFLEMDPQKVETRVRKHKTLTMQSDAVKIALPFNCIANYENRFFGSLGEPEASGAFSVNKENPLDIVIAYAGTNSGQNAKTDILAFPKHIPFLSEKNKGHAGFVYGFYASKIDLERDLANHLDYLLKHKRYDQSQLQKDLKEILKNKEFSDIRDCSELSKLMQLLDIYCEDTKGKEGCADAHKISVWARRDDFFGLADKVKILEASALERLEDLSNIPGSPFNEETIEGLKHAQIKLKKRYEEWEGSYKECKSKTFNFEHSFSNLENKLQDTFAFRSSFHLAAHAALMKQVRLTITGHSMGGALTTLAGLYFGKQFEMNNNLNIVTWAGPRTLNQEAVKSFIELGARNVRVENVRDLIPRLPSAGIFRHVPHQLMLKEGDVLGKTALASHKMALYRRATKKLSEEAINAKLAAENQYNDSWFRNFKHRLWIHSTNLWLYMKNLGKKLNPFS